MIIKRLGTKVLAACAAVLAVSGCGDGNRKTDIMAFENGLTAGQKEAGILTPEVMWKLGRVGGTVLSPDGRDIIYTVTSYDMEADKGVSALWQRTLGDTSARRITDIAYNTSSPTWSADGNTVYFISDRSGASQLWSMPSDGGNAVQITDVKDGIEGYGVAPGGDKLFYVKRVKVGKHASAELHEDLPQSKAKIYDDLMERHWNRWDDGSYLHIFVAGLRDGKLFGDKDILEGESWDAPTAPYFDVSEIAWNNAGTSLAYTCKKLTGAEYALSTDTDIFLYDVAEGTTHNLTEGMRGYDRYPVFSPDDRLIAFTSMERPGNESDKERLFVCEIGSGKMTDMTAGFDYNAAHLQWDGNDAIYFTAPIEATHQLCRVETGSPVRVVTAGEHDINSISFAGGRMVAERTTLASPTEVFEIDLGNGSMSPVTDVNREVYANIRMGDVQKRMVRTTDGKDMLVWVILPPDFDASQSYPALLYCQGGPQSVVSQFWSYRWNAQLMAAQGYVVVMPNRRGLPSFGQEWLDQISGDYSGQNIRDYLSAIDDVAAEPWVDAERLGCVGASYGGYSAYFLMGHHQKRFKAFIAHCGMFNMESMFGSTEELWFPTNDLGGPYWSDNPIAVRSYANSPHKFVRDWNTPILIMVGLDDFRIPYTESLQAFTAARLKGLPSRLVVFENEGHQVFKPQNSLLWNREFFGWLDKYVKNPAPEQIIECH